MRILVVDDSRISRRTLIRVIPRDLGIEVVEASDGREAVDAFRACRFDLVFMDLTMPVMSGYEACQAIVQHDPSARVAIVSADVQPAAQARCAEAGAFTFLCKPISRQDIHALVEEAAGRCAS